MTVGFPPPARGRSTKTPNAEDSFDPPVDESVFAAAKNGENRKNGQNGQNGDNRKDGQNGAAGENGSNGDGEHGSGRTANSGSGDTTPEPDEPGFSVQGRAATVPPPDDDFDEMDRLAGLEQKVEQLTAICEGMWDLVTDATGLDPASLAERLSNGHPAPTLIDEVTGNEGSLCPTCGKPKAADEALCLFCSAGRT